jgi:hypothetical protein
MQFDDALPTIDVAFSMPWTIVRPRVYRFMDKQYVDAFFDHGRLRLSSFERFSKHADEERLDGAEGKAVSTIQDGSHTIVLAAGFGFDCYLLCGSTSSAEGVASAFSPDAIVINNTTDFAGAVARALPHFQNGMEGNCIYRSRREIRRRLEPGRIEQMLEQNKLPENQINMNLLPAIGSHVAMEHCLLKEDRYSHQLEYRFLWRCTNVQEYIDIEVPHARQYCSRLTRDDEHGHAESRSTSAGA